MPPRVRNKHASVVETKTLSVRVQAYEVRNFIIEAAVAQLPKDLDPDDFKITTSPYAVSPFEVTFETTAHLEGKEDVKKNAEIEARINRSSNT